VTRPTARWQAAIHAADPSNLCTRARVRQVIVRT
jgi:hypothetical protein